MSATAEQQRIEADTARRAYWKRWGPYLSERQWATVREDYSEKSKSWEYFSRDHAHFYGDTLQVECPTGSGRMMNLRQVALELNSRLARIFLPDTSGRRPCHGDDTRFATDPHWRDLVLFHEYFHGETGRGLGASHQTGWTALAIANIADVARHRNSASSS